MCTGQKSTDKHAGGYSRCFLLTLRCSCFFAMHQRLRFGSVFLFIFPVVLRQSLCLSLSLSRPLFRRLERERKKRIFHEVRQDTVRSGYDTKRLDRDYTTQRRIGLGMSYYRAMIPPRLEGGRSLGNMSVWLVFSLRRGFFSRSAHTIQGFFVHELGLGRQRRLLLVGNNGNEDLHTYLHGSAHFPCRLVAVI